jgi:hypothetical protein
MFEDIINKKFEGIDIENRDIASEIKASIMSVVSFAEGEMGMDPEGKEFLSEFFDQNIDEMTQMYLDYFEPEELIEMLDFEMTESAKKKLRFQLKIQEFMGEKMIEILIEKDEEEFDESLLDALKSLEQDDEDYESHIWDSEEKE